MPTILAQSGVTVEEVGRVVHGDGDTYAIIVKDLKEKSSSKKQIKLALLLGVIGLLQNNKATIAKDSLMSMCKQYAAFDPSNFASYMRANKNWFLATGHDGWVLTVPGQERAAEVVKQLAQ